MSVLLLYTSASPTHCFSCLYVQFYFNIYTELIYDKILLFKLKIRHSTVCVCASSIEKLNL